MKFSIITVCRNSEKTIEATLRSVAAQDYPHVEHLVIDGASTDGTLAVVERYRDRLAHFVSEPDRGMYDAMNKGVLAATGDYLYFLNADDEFYDSRVLGRAAEFLTRQHPELAWGDVVVIGHEPPRRRAISRWADRLRPLRTDLIQEVGPNGELETVCRHRTIDRISLYYHCPMQQSFFYRASAFATIGRFDARYRLAGDHDWLLRAVATGAVRPRYMDMKIVRFGWGGVSNEPAQSGPREAERLSVLASHYGPLERALLAGPLIQVWMRAPGLRRWACRAILRDRRNVRGGIA